jgi:hypothetical protein
MVRGDTNQGGESYHTLPMPHFARELYRHGSCPHETYAKFYSTCLRIGNFMIAKIDWSEWFVGIRTKAERAITHYLCLISQGNAIATVRVPTKRALSSTPLVYELVILCLRKLIGANGSWGYEPRRSRTAFGYYNFVNSSLYSCTDTPPHFCSAAYLRKVSLR